MNRWITLAVGTAIALGSHIGRAAEVNGPEVHWNLSFWGKPRASSTAIETISKIVKAKTDGHFTVKIAYGGALSKPKENLDGIKLGAFQGAVFCNFYHPGKNPTNTVLSLPFLPIGDLDVLQYVTEQVYAHPSMKRDMDRWNARTYISAVLPQYEAMGRGDPPLKLEDWKGKRVRAGGGMGEAMKLLGATKMTVPAPETYTMLDRGTVDAITFPFTYAFAAYKFDEVSSWFTTNLSLGTADCPIVFNKDAYAKLPPQYKQLLEEVKPQAYAAVKKAYRDIDKKNLPAFKKEMKAITYTEEELARFRKAGGRPVWDAWVKKWEGRIPAQEILDLVLNAAAEGAKLKKEGKL